MVWDFQQFAILTSVDSDEPLQPAFKLRNSKWCSVSSWTIIEYSSDLQRLWSDCAYAQADLRLCWSHIPHCWKSHALAQFSKSAATKLTIVNLISGQMTCLTLCMMAIFHAFVVVCWLFTKLSFSHNQSVKQFWIQIRTHVGPVLGPNCLQMLSAADKSCH